jgi:hypothetical protein
LSFNGTKLTINSVFNATVAGKSMEIPYILLYIYISLYKLYINNDKNGGNFPLPCFITGRYMAMHTARRTVVFTLYAIPTIPIWTASPTATAGCLSSKKGVICFDRLWPRNTVML